MKTFYNKYNYKLHQLVKWIRHYVVVSYHHNFNKTVRKQLKDYKSIPIIIISFNQLSHLKKLISFLENNGYKNLVIIDNNSTYPPLLDYFNELKGRINIYRLKKNYGHLSFWKNKEIFSKYSRGYYVITDPDINPIEKCPENFLQRFRKLLDQAYDRTKVGFSLKIDDIPSTNPNKATIEKWEQQYYKTKIKTNVYKAPIDTTFAIYRPYYNYKLKHFTKAWRTAYPYQARHCSWYYDINNLTEEQSFYIKTANASSSWLINPDGNLINEEHKSIYTK